MKRIEIEFTVNVYCSMFLDVPDDYQFPSTDPEEFWEDLKEQFGEQLEVDLFDLHEYNREDLELFNFHIDDLELDRFERVYLRGDDGKEMEFQFDRFQFD